MAEEDHQGGAGEDFKVQGGLAQKVPHPGNDARVVSKKDSFSNESPLKTVPARFEFVNAQDRSA